MKKVKKSTIRKPMEDLYTKYKALFPSQTEALCKAAAGDRLAHAYILFADDPSVREEYSILLAQIRFFAVLHAQESMQEFLLPSEAVAAGIA